jgi:transposase-like protein
LNQIPRQTALFILASKGKIANHALVTSLNVSSQTISAIWNNCIGLRLPRHYSPPRNLVRRMELSFSKSRKGIYLSEKHTREAQADILDLILETRKKEVLIRYICGESIEKLSRYYGVNKNTLNDWKRKSLLRIKETLGKKEWIKMALKEP